jgi:hypothetical protein
MYLGIDPNQDSFKSRIQTKKKPGSATLVLKFVALFLLSLAGRCLCLPYFSAEKVKKREKRATVNVIGKD